MRHPAKYSKALLPTLFAWTKDIDGIILDPFAGVGSAVFSGRMIYNELEREWADQCPRPVTRGDARHLPLRTGSVAAVVTSPTYGNRMADHHEAKDDSRRNTYRHAIERPLHPANSGAMQWGDEYRWLHVQVWWEACRVLRPWGVLIVNVKDHIRKGERQEVATWHRDVLTECGLLLTDARQIPCPGNRQGQNGALRVDHEMLYRFIKPTN